ncbi:MAG: SDR family oxidoreductase [Pseudomonadota bacterium]
MRIRKAIRQVSVVTGMGAMGMACARAIGTGVRLLVADNDPARLEQAVATLGHEGYQVSACLLDLGEPQAAAELAAQAQALGALRAFVHTAAISQSQAADAARIYAVNLDGTALLLEAMLNVAGPGSVGVVIASMGAQFVSVPDDIERALALAPAGQLGQAVQGMPGWDDKNLAYLIAKRGNQLRVESAALAWAGIGARLVSVSPGVISTAQGLQELREHPAVAKIVADCPAGRIGTPQDIADAVAWLIGPHASFITGIDLRVDGGTIAHQRWNHSLQQQSGGRTWNDSLNR